MAVMGMWLALLLGPLGLLFMADISSQEDSKATQQQVVVANTPAGDEILIGDYETYIDYNYYPEYPMDLYIEDESLYIDLEYSGGCEDHYFLLIFDDSQLGSTYPDTIELVIMHNYNNDYCEALLFETHKYDLSNVIDRLEKKYGKIRSFKIIIEDQEIIYHP